MPRIIGIDIPSNKRLLIALTYIYGVGRKVSADVITKLGLDPNMKAAQLGQEDIGRLNNILNGEYVVEGDLRRQVGGDIKRLMSINCYRGLRHRAGLPVRGQRTRTNARTRKGPKKRVANKKK